MQLLSSQHSRPAPACLGLQQPGTAASRPSCLLARHGQRTARRRVQARVALSSMEEQARYERDRAAAEARQNAEEAEARAYAGNDSEWQGGSGGYETSWYAWPEGYLGQSFNLSGKLQPRATALRDDVDVLTQWSTTRREEAQFSEHTITSAEESSLMVSAVVGAEVDMGLMKAGGSASFEMFQSYKTSCISHNMVASFQQNHMLEKNHMALSIEARRVLKTLGPEEFKARYGTHFVCGIGYRGAFIGSLLIKLQDQSDTYAAGATFKASYGKCSATGEIKAAMKRAQVDCEVTVEWSKWGADDDGSLDELEENCSSEDPSLTSIRQLAIQTADRATGYPKLIKLRPYSTLPDYVQACGDYGKRLPPVHDQEAALAYLTDRYRRVAYVVSALEQERRSGVGANASPLEATTRQLIAELEDSFTNNDTLLKLRAYFRESVPVPEWSLPPGVSAEAFRTPFGFDGQFMVSQWDRRVFRLDYELFNYIHKPLRLAKPVEADLYDVKTPDGGIGTGRTDRVHIAAVSDASTTSPAGGWWLNYQQQEVFSTPGFYIVVLGLREGVIQQIGSTQCFGNSKEDGKAASKFVEMVLSYQTEHNPIILAMKVGDCSSMWFETNTILHFRDFGGGKTEERYEQVPRNLDEVEFLTSQGKGLSADISNIDKDMGTGNSWACISYPHPRTAGSLGWRGVAKMGSWSSNNMVMAEAILGYNIQGNQL